VIHENDSEYDYDYEQDEHFEQESESDMHDQHRRGDQNSLIESIDDIESGFSGDEFLDEVDGAMRRHTTTHHKESLRNKRSNNEQNSRVRNRKVRNKRRHDREGS
jgi:hypothetical protein